MFAKRMSRSGANMQVVLSKHDSSPNQAYVTMLVYELATIPLISRYCSDIDQRRKLGIPHLPVAVFLPYWLPAPPVMFATQHLGSASDRIAHVDLESAGFGVHVAGYHNKTSMYEDIP